MLSDQSEVMYWASDLQLENTEASTSRVIRRTVDTKEYDSILYGPIVDYSFRNLETLSDCLKLTPRTGIKPYQYTEDKKLMSCSLRLSHNRLCDLTGMKQLIDSMFVEPRRLFWIDLSFNTFPIIDPILNFHGNQISELFEVDKLASLARLRRLTLHGNPVELIKGYRSYVVGIIPQLKSLDYSTITKQDHSTATVLKSFIKHKHAVRRKYND
ncbi:leucine rich repeat containing 51 isoform X2 [Heterodontus francisci]|uniref:leucine rich repeat containing 51 isoform X2 n=1 Tax=Heterodontus francisci TaxID=7792 RepID=UPI00355BFFBE